MSIHRIPDRFLNTTLHFFRESFAIDEIGDLKKNAQILAYASVKANVQASKVDTQFELQGRIYIQDHVAYINRIEGSETREILVGDIAYDQETEVKYLVIGTELWQSMRNNITDSHHIKVILKAITDIPKDEPVVMTQISSKGKISA